MQRQPVIYLTSGKHEKCGCCGTTLEHKIEVFTIKGKMPQDTKQVKENILYCPICKRYYATQKLCCEIVKKYPGYHIDVALYNLRFQNSKRTATKTGQVKSKSKQDADWKISQKSLTTPTFLVQASKTSNNICPKCSSTMNKEKINVPILTESGDFFRYYAGFGMYCHNCKKAYMTEETVVLILKKLQSQARDTCQAEFVNAKIKQDNQSSQYLIYPTIDTGSGIYHPGRNNSQKSSRKHNQMILNPQSFLGEMGYSVDKSMDRRHQILKNAIDLFGKRKVTDHLAFLIATRRSQTNGETKYANAISIWQSDTNYAVSL